MKKLAVYFIFQLLIICPEILCTSVFIALHNLFIPTDTYTPHNLISSCSPAEYFVIELSNILLGLFLLWKISEILRQCIDYLKILTFLQLLLPLIAPVFLNVIISLQKKPEAVLALSIIYWIICIGSYLLFLRAVHSLAQQHREYLQKKMEIRSFDPASGSFVLHSGKRTGDSQCVCPDVPGKYAGWMYQRRQQS